MHVTIYPRTRTTFDFMHSTLSRKRQTSNKKSKRGKKYSFSIPRFSAVKNWSNAGRRKIGAKAIASIDRSLRTVSRKATREMTKVEESFKCIITRRLCTVVCLHIPPPGWDSCFHRSRAFAKNSWRERERTFHVETGEVERPKIRGRQGPRNDETRIIKRFFLLHSRE